ncbi:hypothetical protein F443_19731 [Phytophthora nicotianae P1569]|uniref:RxLR effector PexRD54 WY domain-containing protein n=1 Tax=Phytophthora nicotianae P1569 TaxID=1317065 RepID=V9E3H9_PHYNI|nr:hypothetical protein F443_19731 [Phytophthora nicotianae P1569]
MHYNVARVLAIVAFVATVVAASAATESRKTTPDTRAWSHSFHDDVYLRRDLRAHRHANEERAVRSSTVENVLKSTVSADQLKAGIARGDTMNSVIKALQLQKVGDALLDSAQLTALIKYLKLFNEANPTKKTTLIATLTAHYGNQGLAKIIEAGQQVPKTARMANRLQTEQVQLWMGQGKTPEQVFGLLKLNKFWPLSWISSDLFNRPGLATWVKYLDDFNDANPDKKTTLISILSSRYSDKALANMLIQANKAQSTSSIAKRIQAEQTQLWLKHGKKPEDIFTMLQLEKAGDTLFENPLFSAWIKYADDFRLLYDTDLATMSTLISHYSDEAVAKMITKAHGNPKTKNIAERLESELQRDWLFAKQSTYDVFIMMNLDRTLDKVLENPLFSVWYNYGLYVNKMNLGAFRRADSSDESTEYQKDGSGVAKMADDPLAGEKGGAKKSPFIAGCRGSGGRR